MLPTFSRYFIWLQSKISACSGCSAFPSPTPVQQVRPPQNSAVLDARRTAFRCLASTDHQTPPRKPHCDRVVGGGAARKAANECEGEAWGRARRAGWRRRTRRLVHLGAVKAEWMTVRAHPRAIDDPAREPAAMADAIRMTMSPDRVRRCEPVAERLTRPAGGRSSVREGGLLVCAFPY